MVSRDAGPGASTRPPKECSRPAPARAANGPSEVSTEQVTVARRRLAKTSRFPLTIATSVLGACILTCQSCN